MYSASARRYPSEFEAKAALTEISARLYERGWAVAGDGSFSVRTGPSTVWITSLGCDKKQLKQGDLLRVDLRGSQSQAGHNGIPPDDLMIHLRIYQESQDLLCVLHAYPPGAGALADAGAELPAGQCTPAVRRLGAVPLIRQEEAFGAAERAADFSRSGNGVLLQNDGCLVWGASPMEACQKMEALEYSVNRMNEKACGRTAAAGTTNCTGCPNRGACGSCTCSGLKGVTPILHPGDKIPPRKAEAPAVPVRQDPAPAAPARQNPAPQRGHIPELTIVPHRYTDREKARLGQEAAPAETKAALGPVVHRYSQTQSQPRPAVARVSPAPAAPMPVKNVPVPAAPAPVRPAEPRPAGMPVKDAPRASVQAEVVRRLKEKL